MSSYKTNEAIIAPLQLLTSAGQVATGKTVTATVYDETYSVFSTPTVSEITGKGIYYCTFTPDTEGLWIVTFTCADPILVRSYGWYVQKQVADDIDTLLTRLTATRAGYLDELDFDLQAVLSTIDGYFDVPSKDSTANTTIRDVIGNKTDDPDWFVNQNQSVMGYIKAAAAVGGGISYSGSCDSGMTPSATTIVCDDLKGFGDDFFNTDYVMSIALNDNSHGNAPEGNAPRDIQDYDSTTGTFTVASFTANVEENDKIVISKRILYSIDKVAIAGSPTVNSLAYRLSQFLASGDGDFAGGTPLPSNKSLYDVIVLDRLDNATYGLSALETLVDEIESLLKNATYGLSAIETLVDQVEGYTDLIDDATNGLAAIKAEVEGIGGITPATQANVSTEVDEQVGNYAGQSNLQTLLAALGIPDVSGKSLYTCLITDRLDNATYGLSAIETLVDGLETSVARAVCKMTFWSNQQATAAITAGGESGVVSLPDVVVSGLPSGCTILRAYAIIKIGMIKDTSASDNAVDVATGHVEVQKGGSGGYATAIDIPDNSWPIDVSEATERAGDVLIGDNDIGPSGANKVDGDATYNFELDDIGSDGSNLQLTDVMVGIRIYFTL